MAISLDAVRQLRLWSHKLLIGNEMATVDQQPQWVLRLNYARICDRCKLGRFPILNTR
jgi:hypothetical protein